MPCTIIIAAPHSGSGKTTLTLGIMACLERRGLRVAPFKVGPDFIDPGYHRLITGRPSINLDGWICPEEFVCATFAHHASTADFAVIEGVMGLFDGIGAVSAAGSTGEIAALLKAPVILVVDAKGQARSVAALVRGFAAFDPQVRVAGVIFNNVASDNHAAILKSAVAHSSPDIRVLGAIPRDERLRIPSRHLGLVTADDNPLPAEFVTHLAEVVERHLDLDGLLALGENQGWQGENQRCQAYTFDTSVKGVGLTPIRIAVARDAAFCFVYEDNLRLLREAGAEIVVFSPLADERLPEAIAGIYLPGGYPELFAERLAANGAMKAAIRRAVDEGMPVYAECGGFIYLTKGMTPHPAPDAREGEEFVAIFPVTTRLLPKRKALGYREVAAQAGSIIGPLGTVARGHEFHYSEMAEMPATVERLFRVSREGKQLGLEGYRHKNCLASYVHLHFGSNPVLARSFVASCRKFQVR